LIFVATVKLNLNYNFLSKLEKFRIICYYNIKWNYMRLGGDCVKRYTITLFFVTLLFVVFTYTTAGALEEKYLSRVELMIDHHGKGEQYADGYIIRDLSATGEMMFAISREMFRRGAVKDIPSDVDFCIYAAISSDTGCFKYSSVTPQTHMVASSLLRSGIDAAYINHKLFDSKSFIQLKAEKIGFDNLTLYNDGKIGIICFTYEMKKEHGILDQYMETLIDVARSVEGVEVAAAIRQPKDEGVFRCSMRSSCDVDVSAICASLGGGGHVKAAGCTIEADSMESARETVLKAIMEAF
jgi:phosphoesterase RecJ-like protein